MTASRPGVAVLRNPGNGDDEVGGVLVSALSDFEFQVSCGTWSDATVCSQFPTWAAWAHELKAKQKQQTLVLAPGCSVSISVRQNPASEDGMRALRSLCIALFGDDVVFHAVPVQIKILRCQAVSTSRRHRYLKHLLRLLQLKPQP